jgi:septal ring-binding cell division protein DamX
MLVLQQDVEDLTQDEETLPVKRSKHFADKDASAPKAARESAASTGTKRKSPAKPAAAKAAIEKAAAAKAAAPKATKASPAEKKSAKPAGKGRKAIVLDDDSDDDFQVCLAVMQVTRTQPIQNLAM